MWQAFLKKLHEWGKPLAVHNFGYGPYTVRRYYSGRRYYKIFPYVVYFEISETESGDVVYTSQFQIENWRKSDCKTLEKLW